ncbi:MAG: hypothetical protein ACOX6V_02745 [Patescibacteria group bacterium]|jgi:flagellar basal body-associated protein FliL
MSDTKSQPKQPTETTKTQSKESEVKKVAKKPKKTNNNSLFIILISFSTLFVIGSGVLLSLLPQKGLTVQKLRTQSLAFQISEQDEMLLTQALKETEEEREKVLSAFPTESSLLEFIAIVDSLRSSVEVMRFSVDSDVPTKIGKTPSFLPMTLRIRGSEAAVNAALNKIVNSPYFIKAVTFTKDFDPSSGEVIVQTQFHLFVSDEFTKTNS